VATGKCCDTGKCEIFSAVNATNVATVARKLVTQLRGKALPYRGPLMYPWGADFHFREAGHTFGNMSLVLDEIAARPQAYGARVRLSTLSEYMDHLHGLQPALKFPARDFTEAAFEWGWPKRVFEKGLYPFNYTNESTQFQTGCLTSHSAHKQHSRRVAVHTHAASTAHALATAAQGALAAPESRELLGDLAEARDALGICQHHDSMPGTMEPGVLSDYTTRLDRASAAATQVLQRSLRALAGAAPRALVRASAAPGNHTVLVYNPLAHDRTSVLNTTLPSLALAHRWSIFGADGAVPAQFDVQDPTVVHFLATVPALGFTTFDFVPCTSASACVQEVTRPVETSGALPIKNAVLSLGFEGGLLSSVLNLASTVKARIVQELAAYVNGVGGAYILIETGAAKPLPAPIRVRTVVGPVLSEVLQVFNASGVASSVRQRIRLYQYGHQDTIEVTQMIGTLQLCRELISRYRTDLAPTFLQTDSTGYENHKRGWDTRGIGANYHAMTQRASLVEDGAKPRQLALLTTHTMGAAALAQGQIEHMLIRRLNTTDNQGPAPLNELTPINVTTQLLFGSAPVINHLALRRALEQEHPPIVLRADSVPQRLAFSPLLAGPTKLAVSVHPDAHLLGMSARWGGTIAAGRAPAANSTSSLVVRWMNMADRGAPIPVPLAQLARALTGAPAGRVRCTELTLTMVASRAVAEARRLRWDPGGSPPAAAPVRELEGGCGPGVVDPMDVRTYEFSWTH
jgi:hypothetical protein